MLVWCKVDISKHWNVAQLQWLLQKKAELLRTSIERPPDVLFFLLICQSDPAFDQQRVRVFAWACQQTPSSLPMPYRVVIGLLGTVPQSASSWEPSFWHLQRRDP